MQDVHCGYFKSCKHLIVILLYSLYYATQNLEEQNGDKKITTTCKNLQISDFFLFFCLFVPENTYLTLYFEKRITAKKKKNLLFTEKQFSLVFVYIIQD